jgi:anaerobic selenocysteine-containing dehydrogenase
MVETAGTTTYRTCPLCEATCGVAVTVGPEGAIAVRGDEDDVFSHGFICPKGVALGQLQQDPDRLRTPLVRRGGRLEPAGWDEAYAEAARLLGPILREHGGDALAMYLGNPTVHNHAASLYTPVLRRALGAGYVFTASTVDQMPKQVAAGLMFGTELSVPIPDVDRTDFLLMLGANPLESNGSLLTAADLPGRLRALRRRGGRLVVVDPRRTRTADVADEHLAIRPGTDALLLAALARTLLADGLAAYRESPAAPHLDGLEELRGALEPFTPEAVAPACRIPAERIRRLAAELAQAPTAAVYGRIGTTTTRFGTAASWLVDVVNALTGNLDRPGGVLWPEPPAGSPNTQGTPGRGRGVRIPGSRRTRVRGLPSVFGEFPVAALAEEIDTPSADGTRLRALVTFAGNPVLSTPDSARLEAALGSLDAMISIDAYLNETTRHAHVVLPAVSPLARSHFDLVFASFAVRNTARWSPPSLPLAEGERDEPEVLLGLAAAVTGLTPDQLDDLAAADLARRLTEDPSSRASGRSAEELLAAVSGRRRQERLLDLLLRSGPYGDGFGAKPDGLTLAALEAAPHGIDLGPLRPRLPEVLRTPSGKVELAPPQLVAEAARLAAALDELAAEDGLLLVGRRHLRSNNSWMHNVPLLNGGSNRCTLHVHPADADRLGVADGAPVRVRSRVGELTATAEVTDRVSPGVVSLPHGWGHGAPGIRAGVAAARPGVNSNLLTDAQALDPLSGTAVLNGIPVEVTGVDAPTGG